MLLDDHPSCVCGCLSCIWGQNPPDPILPFSRSCSPSFSVEGVTSGLPTFSKRLDLKLC